MEWLKANGNSANETRNAFLLEAMGDSAPLAQLAVCAPVGLLTALVLICTVPPIRRTALGLTNILRELISKVKR